MYIEIEPKKIKHLLYKSLKIKSYQDYKNLKKKIENSPQITKYILPSIIFKASIYDYKYQYINKPIYKFTIKNFLKKFLSKFYKNFQKILYFVKLIKNVFQKKIYSNHDLIILARHKFIDQLNFFPLSNQMKKKHLVFFDIKDNATNYSSMYKYYKNEFIDLNKYINFFDLINGYKEFYRQKRNLKYMPINIENISDKDFVKKQYIIFFIKLEFYKRVLKHCSPKYFLSTQYLGNEALLYYFKKIRNLNTKFYSICQHGIGGSSGGYLYNASDLVLVPGKVDLDIAKTIKKKHLNLVNIPKMKVVGSVRYEYWKNHLKNKKIKSKRIKILFISTNPIHFKDPIEKKALQIFIKFALNNPQFDYLIKERPKYKNNYLNTFSHQKINKFKVIDDKEMLIEDCINESDICVGVGSSALLRQSAYQDKEIIQLFHNYCYMSKIKNHNYIDNYVKFKNEICERIKLKRKTNYSLILNKKINSIKSIEDVFV